MRVLRASFCLAGVRAEGPKGRGNQRKEGKSRWRVEGQRAWKYGGWKATLNVTGPRCVRCRDLITPHKSFSLPNLYIFLATPHFCPCFSLWPFISLWTLAFFVYGSILIFLFSPGRKWETPPFFSRPLRKSSRVIMAYYLMGQSLLRLSLLPLPTWNKEKYVPPPPRVSYLDLTTDAQTLCVSTGNGSQQREPCWHYLIFFKKFLSHFKKKSVF